MAVLNEANYGKLLSTTLPRVIRDESELQKFTRILLELEHVENPTPEQDELSELLTKLVEDFENENYQIPSGSPVEVIAFLMEQGGITPKDLIRVLGSKGTVSNVINGKRGIGVATAAKLGEFFHVRPELFIDWRAPSASAD